MSDDLHQQERDLWGDEPSDDFDQWLDYGVKNGFCSPQVCATHAGIPSVDDEDATEDPDFCVHIVRLGTPEDWQAEIDSFNEDRMAV